MKEFLSLGSLVLAVAMVAWGCNGQAPPPPAPGRDAPPPQDSTPYQQGLQDQGQTPYDAPGAASSGNPSQPGAMESNQAPPAALELNEGAAAPLPGEETPAPSGGAIIPNDNGLGSPPGN